MSRTYQVPYSLIPDLSVISNYELTNLVVPKYQDKFTQLKYEELRNLVKNKIGNGKLNWFDKGVIFHYKKQQFKVPPTEERKLAGGYRWILRGLSPKQANTKLQMQYGKAQYCIANYYEELTRKSYG